MITKYILEELEDCWGIGNGSLIAKDYRRDPETDRIIYISDVELETWIKPYIGTEVMVMSDDNVYGFDGEFLGEHYE